MWLHRALPLGNDAEIEVQDRFSAVYAEAGSPRGMMLLGAGTTARTDLYLRLPEGARADRFPDFALLSDTEIPKSARLLLGHGEDYELFVATHGA